MANDESNQIESCTQGLVSSIVNDSTPTYYWSDLASEVLNSVSVTNLTIMGKGTVTNCSLKKTERQYTIELDF